MDGLFGENILKCLKIRQKFNKNKLKKVLAFALKLSYSISAVT